MVLSELYLTLNKVIKDRVFYGNNVYENQDSIEFPYIVYQEMNSRPLIYLENKAQYYKSTVQITLVTKEKDINLKKKLQITLQEAGLTYVLISEFLNDDKSLSRVYEISMEEI